MRHLLGHTAMTTVLAATAIHYALPEQARAETTISSKTTTPLLTSTAASGQADSISIASGGSVVLSSGTGVTMDSDNAVTNAGTITISDADGAIGIRAASGTSGAITNSGTITLDEDYTATDTDSDDDVDGAFAKGTNRTGILVEGPHTGDIAHSGTITIEGNQSYGIRLTGPLTGALTTSGTIAVTGDGSTGIQADAVTGNVWLRGSTSVQGASSTGVALDGDITGALKVQSTIVATGYRSTTAPTDTSDLDADDLLQGSNALRISGSVSGGIIFDTTPTDSDSSDDDEDDDGVTDTSEGTASVVSYGSAAAVQIGSATNDVAIGAVASDTSGYGLIVKGAIAGRGVYTGVDAQGMTIGGLGGDVVVTKGMSVSGSIIAVSLDSNATALRIGSGASVDAIVNSGSIASSGATLTGKSSRALVIDSGAQVSSLTNSGAISAAAGEDGTAIAILDSSGGLSTITNTGEISAAGADDGRNTAIDLSANSSGVTLTQSAAASGSAAPKIVGAILTGSGNDTITVSAGTITGDMTLGAGNDSVALSGSTAMTGDIDYGTGTATLSLAGTSSLTGDVDFGGNSGTLTINDTAALVGQLRDADNVDVVINSGTLTESVTGAIALKSLTLGSGGVIGVTVDGATGTSTLYDVAGAASFASGSQVQVKLAQVSGSEGSFTIVQAGSLSGTPTLDTSSTLLPYMFKGTIASDSSAGTVSLDITRKTTTELGLNRSLSSAYNAIYAALDNDTDVAQSVLAITDGDSFRQSLRQMLPDHAGGAFETVTAGSRAAARSLADPGSMIRGEGPVSTWLQQVAWGSAKSVGDTASYDVSGWGASGGAEVATGIGAFGLGLAYLHGTDEDSDTDNAVSSDQYELSAHWRGGRGPLMAYARLSAAHISFDSSRAFVGNTGSADVTRTAKGKWNGQLYSATAGASYEKRFGKLSLRPIVSFDYYRLKEGGYAETGGGDAFNLTVASRKSDELAANGSIAAGYDMGGANRDEGWLRVEMEGGRRQLIGGSLGATTASFTGGDSFTLSPEQRTSGWTGKARILGGSDAFVAAGEFSAEQQQDHVSIAFRASIRFPM